MVVAHEWYIEVRCVITQEDYPAPGLSRDIKERLHKFGLYDEKEARKVFQIKKEAFLETGIFQAVNSNKKDTYTFRMKNDTYHLILTSR